MMAMLGRVARTSATMGARPAATTREMRQAADTGGTSSRYRGNIEYEGCNNNRGGIDFEGCDNDQGGIYFEDSSSTKGGGTWQQDKEGTSTNN